MFKDKILCLLNSWFKDQILCLFGYWFKNGNDFFVILDFKRISEFWEIFFGAGYKIAQSYSILWAVTKKALNKRCPFDQDGCLLQLGNKCPSNGYVMPSLFTLGIEGMHFQFCKELFGPEFDRTNWQMVFQYLVTAFV